MLIKNKVFLGGTCAGRDWRSELIPKLKVDYFNPVVEDWTDADFDNEIKEREDICGTHLYVLTSDMAGIYSVAEVIDSILIGKHTILQVIPEGFDEKMLKSLRALCKLVVRRGGFAFIDDRFNYIIAILNNGIDEIDG